MNNLKQFTKWKLIVYDMKHCFNAICKDAELNKTDVDIVGIEFYRVSHLFS